MWTLPYWINCTLSGRLAVSSRPRSNDWLEDEIKAWRSGGVNVVVSLLTSEEAESLGLGRENEICATNGIEYRVLPIADRSVPECVKHVLNLADILLASQSGKNVVIHCRQGIGRSGLVAMAVLLRSGQEPRKGDSDGNGSARR